MIEVKNIYKNFDKLSVLKGVSTEITKGEVISIIGASGSGKSTLLRCMNLLETPTFGEVWMDGKLLTPVDPYLHFEVIRASKTYNKFVAAGISDEEAIKKIKKEDLLKESFSREGKEYRRLMKKIYRENHIDINEARQKMGMVFQQFNLFNNKSVLDNITLAPIKVGCAKIRKAKAKNVIITLKNLFKRKKEELIKIEDTPASVKKKAKEKAESRLENANRSDYEYKLAEIKLKKSLARLRVSGKKD
jgi:polar amino acid transport system ATP-binding protein